MYFRNKCHEPCDNHDRSDRPHNPLDRNRMNKSTISLIGFQKIKKRDSRYWREL